MLSTLVFIGALIEFLLVKEAATSVFATLFLISLVDVIGGWIGFDERGAARHHGRQSAAIILEHDLFRKPVPTLSGSCSNAASNHAEFFTFVRAGKAGDGAIDAARLPPDRRGAARGLRAGPAPWRSIARERRRADAPASRPRTRNRGDGTNDQVLACGRRFIGLLVNGPPREERGIERRSAIGCDPHGRRPVPFRDVSGPGRDTVASLGPGNLFHMRSRGVKPQAIAFALAIARARGQVPRAISAAIRPTRGALAFQEIRDRGRAARARDARCRRHRRHFQRGEGSGLCVEYRNRRARLERGCLRRARHRFARGGGRTA